MVSDVSGSRRRINPLILYLECEFKETSVYKKKTIFICRHIYVQAFVCVIFNINYRYFSNAERVAIK